MEKVWPLAGERSASDGVVSGPCVANVGVDLAGTDMANSEPCGVRGLWWWRQSNRAPSHGRQISDEDGDVYRRRLRSGYPPLSCIYLGSGGSAGLRVGHELAKKGKDAGTMPAASFAVLIFDPDAPIVGHRATTIDPRRAQRGPREAREAV